MREIKFRCWTGLRMLQDVASNMIVDEGALMQYTGHKDMNGIEIYEGDILRWGHVENFTELSGVRVAVVELYPALQFKAFLPREHTFEFGCFAYADCLDRCVEVIGNIYENPELLEVTNVHV